MAAAQQMTCVAVSHTYSCVALIVSAAAADSLLVLNASAPLALYGNHDLARPAVVPVFVEVDPLHKHEVDLPPYRASVWWG